MGNACCSERSDQDSQATKPVKLAEPSSAPGNQGNTNTLPSTYKQDVESFNRGPSDFFSLNDKILNLITKHPISNLNINTAVSQTSFEKIDSTMSARPHKYFGQTKAGSKEGVGQLHYTDERGEFVVCTFVGGSANGNGAAYYPNGDYFEGEFRQGQQHQGILYLATQDKYEGAFEGGLYHGKGQLTFADGRKYVGEFSKGVRNGYGNYTWPNGSSYNGNWKDGKQHGKGIFIDEKGVTFDGEFYQGKKVLK